MQVSRNLEDNINRIIEVKRKLEAETNPGIVKVLKKYEKRLKEVIDMTSSSENEDEQHINRTKTLTYKYLVYVTFNLDSYLKCCLKKKKREERCSSFCTVTTKNILVATRPATKTPHWPFLLNLTHRVTTAAALMLTL